MKRTRLGGPALAAASVAAAAAAVCGVLVTTQAAFTARTATEALPVSAGRLDVALTTSLSGAGPVRVDFSEAGPDLMWPEEGAFTVSLRNTGDLDGRISALETVEVVDGGTAGSGALSRALEVAVSTDPGQDWHDPALRWEPVADQAAPEGRVVASDLGSLPVGQTRTVHLRLRFTGGEETASTGATVSFRLAATVTQAH
ncbi:hypothetical protein [Thermobifida cellulosilytica]|uniref:Camelysin metallo-endopeptidase n=1 Tax=Thermobifida cellulosilytica TB100 TaxID=665004 RepID=A0A147KLJ4_THECS|nr:hypothetical protein [Thermobifida cellulosilytica]KUP98123.1 hypothetical protein AC529_02985 [Thermobifida cellulosilytica TB100]